MNTAYSHIQSSSRYGIRIIYCEHLVVFTKIHSSRHETSAVETV